MITFVEQNTDEWVRAKIGCFSSSEVVRLFKGGKRNMTPAELKAREKGDTRKTVDTLFGPGAYTYINEKVSERINLRPKYKPTTKKMERGLTLEDEALDMFSTITGIKMQRSGLFKLNDYVAGTPDGHLGKRKIRAIAEVKCLDPENHSEICELDTVGQLRAYDEGFYAQCQMNMYITGCDTCYFISYDNRPMGYNDNGELDEELYDYDKFIYCIKWFKIKRDEKFIEELEMRLDAACGIMVEKLEKRMKTAAKNLARYNRTQRKLAA